MFGFISVHLLLLLLPGSCTGSLLSQWPQHLSIQKGKTAEMHCYQNGMSNTNMYWYRQLRGAGLQLIATSIGTSDPTFEKDFKTRFKGTRSDLESCSLKILKLEVSDTAVYYCAASDHSDTNTCRAVSKTSRVLRLLEDRLETGFDNIYQHTRSSLMFAPFPKNLLNG
ncbi:hypothetical protein chiPu_0017408 [Chiloscyllium punctatum]|uniref:Ig-like domain-containing protein n=1 Tax=Chiloscyllium punctatum TaxID=137246 RepID=A0A401RFR0_CHIPU|nr:hypothetical protein [Chiloscyllium punctatum]